MVQTGELLLLWKEPGRNKRLGVKSESEDLYSHTYWMGWPFEVELNNIRVELFVLETAQADIPSLPP